MSYVRRTLRPMPKDSQIIVRAPQTEIDRWFDAARLLARLAGEGSDPAKPGLSRHARRLLNQWADAVLKTANGGK